MRSGCGWAGGRALVVAVILAGWTAAGVEAGPIQADAMYSTSGVIDPDGEGTPGCIEFRGVDRDEVCAPGQLVLGEFLVKDLPEGDVMEFERTPFFIDLMLEGADPISLSGKLDGTIIGGGAVDVVATFDRTPYVPTDTLPPSEFDRWIFGLDGVTGILSVPDGDIVLENGSGDGTVIQAQIRSFEPVPIPEPATITALAAGLAGLAWKRKKLHRTEDCVKNTPEVE